MQTVSLQSFYNQILEIAKKINEDYIEVRVYLNKANGLTFDAYINGQGWHKGKSIEEVVQRIIAKLNGEEYLPPIDVSIEEPTKEEAY